jgi:hypothetical protein
MAHTRQDATDQRQGDPTAEHTLPQWVNFIQDNLFLSFLILAEAYLLGTLMALGWVPDIEAPSHWGTYHAVGVVLFFSAGAMAAGVALRCSVKAAGCFQRHEWGFAIFNFTGLLLFSGAEIWASLSERSANLRPTPADGAVLSLLGLHGSPISPTVVVVALLLPFATLYYGFSQQQARETQEDREEKAAAEDFALERRLARAQAQARVRQVQVAGLARTARAGLQALRTSEQDVAAQAGERVGRDATADEEARRPLGLSQRA